jgi:hypothetical protein
MQSLPPSRRIECMAARPLSCALAGMADVATAVAASSNASIDLGNISHPPVCGFLANQLWGHCQIPLAVSIGAARNGEKIDAASGNRVTR